MITSGNNLAIEVKNLSKIFKIYSRPSDLLTEIILRKPRHREFLALSNISFEVQRGEVVGLVGRNGAGKSTLLRILAGTLDKTTGDLKVRGKLSAILELGSGFNPDYTGLENIRMGGLCLGMSRKDVDARTDWIIEFSELQDFINQPFRTYSSGMQARLTFATAAALEPDILIVDEALSVGDARFQLKCFTYLRDLCSRGSTVLLVSHDTNAITSLCTRAIFLEKGSIVEMGDSQAVTAHYVRYLYGLNHSGQAAPADAVPAQEEKHSQASPKVGTAADQKAQFEEAPPAGKPGLQSSAGKEKKAEILSLGILDEVGQTVNKLAVGGAYRLVMRVRFSEAIADYIVGFLIRSRLGVELFGTTTRTLGLDMPLCRPGSVYEYSLNITMNMVNGPYFLTGAISLNDETGIPRLLDIRHDEFIFEIISRPKLFFDATVINLAPVFSFQVMNNN
jgi:lipopolysaccharide transport system ATP-binding protein